MNKLDCVVTHRGCDSSPRFKGRNGMATYSTSVGLMVPRKCSMHIGLHALSGCNTVSYPFGKGKKAALKFLEIEIPGINQMSGQHGTTHAQLKTTTDSLLLLFYGQKRCTTMNDARARFFVCDRKKPCHWRNCRRPISSYSCTWSELCE